jgi:hypothetical protein
MKNRPIPLYQYQSTNSNSNDDGNDKFYAYSCMIPFARKIDQPWVSYSNVCPCDLQQSNVTGRGFTPCAFGINNRTDDVQEYKPLVNYKGEQISSSNINSMNNLYPGSTSIGQFVPPQLDPRALIQVGYEWRS